MYTYYKYINNNHAENLINKGEILIRPLNEFKNVEKFGGKIGDAKGGTEE